MSRLEPLKFLSSRRTLTSWPRLKTKHRTHLDVRLKAYVYTYNIMLSCVRASTLKQVLALTLTEPSSASSLLPFLTPRRSVFFMLGLSGRSGLWSLLWSWRYLSAMLCTHCCRAATLHWQHSVMQEGMRATTSEGRKVTWKSGVGERCQE